MPFTHIDTNKYKQHEHPEILIPQHISQIALYSAPLFLICSAVHLTLRYYELSALLFGLHITSVLHWSRVQRFGVIKTVDIICAVSTIGHITLQDRLRLTPLYSMIWIGTATVSITAFSINEIILYYQVTRECPRDTEDIMTAKHYECFSLKYTRPNTILREMAYYRSTYAHIIFLHALLTIASTFCSVMTAYSNRGKKG